jgi:RNA polymerase sigma-70 factor (ECF subfamily)
MGGLVETVRQARPELAVPDGFEPTLAARVASARDAWRDVAVEPSRFVTFLASRLVAPIERSLDQLHVEDLYLACGCLDAAPTAVAAFDRMCLSGIDLAISAAGASAEERPALRRAVRERLLVASGGAPPRLAAYAGKGSLGSWVRIFAMREAQRMLAAGPHP